ncbi:3-dehydroquinate dehydratase [Cetobacterium ceti]|uniref:3-dehydroquinate dehydratase n=1 Tax=Cetobacterium ceti TaxID=180163 RepID=A0A1T4JYI5_9FUSO|nr:type II 3-dehydroquinate dehydratase [Cetobacterium ceti]SJZ35241.1 3-dehydroquinate dehydratase [Cetobacterium ceti]
MNILVINGPNLNFLGIREPEKYGKLTLEKINDKILKKARGYNYNIEFFQSNHEGDLVDKIQEVYGKVDYIVINPGALTHYSIAIRDALLSVQIKTIEVHLSNVYTREEFRHKSVISDIVIGKITGFGYYGYLMALDFIQNEENLM